MRSADEPKSRFYECVECGNTWRDDSWFYKIIKVIGKLDCYY